MVMENWASVKEAKRGAEEPSLSSSSSSQALSSAQQTTSSGEQLSKLNHPAPMPPPTTDISRIIDQLQSGNRLAVEHGLCSLMPLIERSTDLDDPEPLRVLLLRQRVNQLLETLVDTFTALHQEPTTGVPVMAQIHLLRATSHVIEAIIESPYLAAGVSSKTIAAYVHAMLPVRRQVPSLDELRAAFDHQSPAGKIRRLTDLMARHGSFVLKRQSSLVGNHLDRSHLLVALLRETQALLSGGLQPHFGYLILQITKLSDAFKEYMEKKRAANPRGDGQEQHQEPPVPGEDDDDRLQQDLFDRGLNLDLLLYEANRVCAELVHRDFEGRYENLVSSLIEDIESLLLSLIDYARLTGRHIMEHFVLLPRPLEESVPYRFIAGRLILSGYQRHPGRAPRGLPENLFPIDRIIECIVDVQQLQMARRFGIMPPEILDMEGMDFDQEFVPFFDVHEAGDDEGDDYDDDGEEDLYRVDMMVEDGLLPQDRLPNAVPYRHRRRPPLPAEAVAELLQRIPEHLRPGDQNDEEEEEEQAAVPLFVEAFEAEEKEEDVVEDAQCIASRELLLRLVLAGHLGHRTGWDTTAMMALGEAGGAHGLPRAIFQPPINDYGQPRVAVMAAAVGGGGQQPLLMQN